MKGLSTVCARMHIQTQLSQSEHTRTYWSSSKKHDLKTGAYMQDIAVNVTMQHKRKQFPQFLTNSNIFGKRASGLIWHLSSVCNSFIFNKHHSEGITKQSDNQKSPPDRQQRTVTQLTSSDLTALKLVSTLLSCPFPGPNAFYRILQITWLTAFTIQAWPQCHFLVDTYVNNFDGFPLWQPTALASQEQTQTFLFF